MLGQIWADFDGPAEDERKSRIKARRRPRRLLPVTTARSAGSFKSFRGRWKWGQNQRENEILRSLFPNAYSHKKKTGVKPWKGAVMSKKRNSPSTCRRRKRPFWSAGNRRMGAGASPPFGRRYSRKWWPMSSSTNASSTARICASGGRRAFEMCGKPMAVSRWSSMCARPGRKTLSERSRKRRLLWATSWMTMRMNRLWTA